ncbi:MAG: hypothetical protein ACK5XN_22005 [Bacteroidota bacterium]
MTTTPLQLHDELNLQWIETVGNNRATIVANLAHLLVSIGNVAAQEQLPDSCRDRADLLMAGDGPFEGFDEIFKAAAAAASEAVNAQTELHLAVFSGPDEEQG